MKSNMITNETQLQIQYITTDRGLTCPVTHFRVSLVTIAVRWVYSLNFSFIYLLIEVKQTSSNAFLLNNIWESCLHLLPFEEYVSLSLASLTIDTSNMHARCRPNSTKRLNILWYSSTNHQQWHHSMISSLMIVNFQLHVISLSIKRNNSFNEKNCNCQSFWLFIFDRK